MPGWVSWLRRKLGRIPRLLAVAAMLFAAWRYYRWLQRTQKHNRTVQSQRGKHPSTEDAHASPPAHSHASPGQATIPPSDSVLTPMLLPAVQPSPQPPATSTASPAAQTPASPLLADTMHTPAHTTIHSTPAHHASTVASAGTDGTEVSTGVGTSVVLTDILSPISPPKWSELGHHDTTYPHDSLISALNDTQFSTPSVNTQSILKTALSPTRSEESKATAVTGSDGEYSAKGESSIESFGENDEFSEETEYDNLIPRVRHLYLPVRATHKRLWFVSGVGQCFQLKATLFYLRRKLRQRCGESMDQEDIDDVCQTIREQYTRVDPHLSGFLSLYKITRAAWEASQASLAKQKVRTLKSRRKSFRRRSLISLNGSSPGLNTTSASSVYSRTGESPDVMDGGVQESFPVQPAEEWLGLEGDAVVGGMNDLRGVSSQHVHTPKLAPANNTAPTSAGFSGTRPRLSSQPTTERRVSLWELSADVTDSVKQFVVNCGGLYRVNPTDLMLGRHGSVTCRCRRISQTERTLAGRVHEETCYLSTLGVRLRRLPRLRYTLQMPPGGRTGDSPPDRGTEGKVRWIAFKARERDSSQSSPSASVPGTNWSAFANIWQFANFILNEEEIDVTSPYKPAPAPPTPSKSGPSLSSKSGQGRTRRRISLLGPPSPEDVQAVREYLQQLNADVGA